MPGFWGKLLYYISRGIVWLLAKLMFRLRVSGLRTFPRRGPVMLACNHVSHLDPPLVTMCAPRLTQNMAKRELFSIKILDWFMRSIGTILVDRGKGKQALLSAIEMLKRNASILIFPEGTRSITGQLGKGHTGAVIMAARTGCSIVPTVIIGSEQAMRKGTKGIRSHPVQVVFGEPYSLPIIPEPTPIPKDMLERECCILMRRIAALLPPNQQPTAEQWREWYGQYAE